MGGMGEKEYVWRMSSFLRIRGKALSFGLLGRPEENLRAAEGEGYFCTVFLLLGAAQGI